MPGYELIGEEERAAVNAVFDSGGVLFRHGFDALRNGSYQVREFERRFAGAMSAPHALAVTSGTAALRVALAALGVRRGDEVVTQSFTFVATVEAIVEAGALPVCTDIDKTLNMSPEDLERRITSRTRAVIVVHMLGVPARLTEIQAICAKHGIPLIEDVAWGCGGRLNGRSLGTFGDIGTYSFDFAKTMTTGEGGMLVFQRREHFERAAAWHDHGHENNPSLPRWEDSRSSSGFNYRMMELQAAVGIAQLEKLPTVVARHRANAESIWSAIAALAFVERREVIAGAEVTADALVFFVDTKQRAAACRQALLRHGLSTKILPEAITWHFAATWRHVVELTQSHPDLEQAFEPSRSLLERAISIPITVNMTADTPERVRQALEEVA